MKNIIRSTDNHNAALLAREAEESRARLQKLRDDKRSRVRPQQAIYSVRDRRENRDEPLLKRRRVDEADSEKSAKQERGRYENGKRDERKRRSPASDQKSEVEGAGRRHRRHREHESRREIDTHISSHRQGHRSRSPKRESSHRNPRMRSRSRSRSPHRRRRDRSPSSTNTDPIEALLGPHPPTTDPVRSRGRGVYSSKSSHIDSHFESTYDPSADVGTDDNDAVDNDWDSALEAMRDRAKWKQGASERLKAAGFSEKEIERYEKGGKRAGAGHDGEDQGVRWSKKGEGREWDRGK